MVSVKMFHFLYSSFGCNEIITIKFVITPGYTMKEYEIQWEAERNMNDKASNVSNYSLNLFKYGIKWSLWRNFFSVINLTTTQLTTTVISVEFLLLYTELYYPDVLYLTVPAEYQFFVYILIMFTNYLLLRPFLNKYIDFWDIQHDVQLVENHAY